MEKVKEESRRKSEELESLRRRVQESDMMSQGSLPSPRAVPNPGLLSAIDPGTNEPVSYTNDDYLMDFSKPASYQPPSSEPPVVVRRRSLEPEPLPKSSPPPMPQAPPRRSVSRDQNRSAPPPPPTPAPAPKKEVKDAHSLLMEELRRSAQQRMQKVSSEFG